MEDAPQASSFSPVSVERLTHSRDALLLHLEKIVANYGVSLERVQEALSGFVVTLTGLDRYWIPHPNTEIRYLNGLTPLDDLGNCCVSVQPSLGANEKPIGVFLGLCHRSAVPAMTSYIRDQLLGPLFQQRFSAGDLLMHVVSVAQALRIQEHEPNDSRIPSFCATRWGYLFRWSQFGATAALGFLSVSKSIDETQPVSTILSRDCVATFGFANDPEHPIAIAFHREIHRAVAWRDLLRWRATVHHGRKESIR
jgi:hypothetical protein